MEATEKSREETKFFSRLKMEEQQLLAPKLLRVAAPESITSTALQQAHAIFHDLILMDGQRREERFLTLRNFVRQVGAMPVVWRHVNSFIGIGRSYLELTVHDHQGFLSSLKAEGFAVNSWMEKVSRWAGHGHRFDSARARTEHRFEPQLHLVNDRADEADYGPNYFFVHWDAQSVYANRSGLLSRIAAGRTHKHHTASPEEVAAYLDSREGELGRRGAGEKSNDK